MGTTKCGRYLNTEGSARSVSDYALVHSSEGAFIRSRRRVNGKMIIELRLANGGHGQKGMDLLDKYGLKYEILRTYQNGVRTGNVLTHKDPKKRTQGQQSWFPKSWTEKDIRHAGEHVAGLRKNRHIPDGQKIFGMWKGVRVGVIMTHGKIGTVFPDVDQPSKPKKKRGKK